MVIIFEIIIVAFVVYITDLLTYKFIRHLDKKEREHLAEIENKRIQELLKLADNDTEKVIDLLND